MRFLLRDVDAHVECHDPDHPDFATGGGLLGSGNTSDEAFGEAVRNAWLAAPDSITVDDIDSEDIQEQIAAAEVPQHAPCCDNEQRSINGGCSNCGDPCL